MKKGEALIIAAFLSSTVCAMSMYLVWTSMAVQSMINTLADAFPLLVTLTEAAIIAGLVFAIVKMGIHLYGHALHIRNIYPDSGGAFPLVPSHRNYIDIIPESVRLVQALTDSHIAGNKKPNATAIREAVTASRAPMLEANPMEALPAPADNGQFDIGRVDPRTAPHWLFIGSTGSGKSTAAFTVLDQLRQRHGAEFTLCEPGGVDWNTQADHIEYSDIADAIEGEYTVMRERQEHLRSADVSHIADLPEEMRYRYLVLEEADSLFDNLARDKAKDTLFWLRELARMGRKTGIGLIALSQTALADVFSTHVRGNLNNVFLFRGSQQIARNWGVSKLVDLPTLPPGRAYDLAFERAIQFPHATRPDLRSGATERATNGAIAAKTAESAAIAGAIALPDDPERMTVAQRRYMYNMYDAHGGYRPALRALGLSEGGHWFYVLKDIVRQQEGL